MKFKPALVAAATAAAATAVALGGAATASADTEVQWLGQPGELVNGTFLPETRAHLLALADNLKERHGIDGLILGGTELPLILKEDTHNGIRFLDTTRIHVKRIVERLLE